VEVADDIYSSASTGTMKKCSSVSEAPVITSCKRTKARLIDDEPESRRLEISEKKVRLSCRYQQQEYEAYNHGRGWT
jgi:hypothetical protein